jgi:P27 family predicted phage terminase small subunit
MPGPKPKPTTLKILNGNPGKRRLNRREPKPRGPAACPAWLSKNAKTEWKRICPELRRLGLLTSVDVASLAAYCSALSDLRWSEETLLAEGMVFTTEKGFMIAHPAIGVRNAARTAIKNFAGMFGLSPSDRSKIRGPDLDESEDKLERFLKEAT